MWTSLKWSQMPSLLWTPGCRAEPLVLKHLSLTLSKARWGEAGGAPTRPPVRKWGPFVHCLFLWRPDLCPMHSDPVPSQEEVMSHPQDATRSLPGWCREGTLALILVSRVLDLALPFVSMWLWTIYDKTLGLWMGQYSLPHMVQHSQISWDQFSASRPGLLRMIWNGIAERVLASSAQTLRIQSCPSFRGKKHQNLLTASLSWSSKMNKLNCNRNWKNDPHSHSQDWETQCW